MANFYSTNHVVEFLQGNDKVENYKVTKVELLDFNDMEGWNYLVHISVKSVEGYKNKWIKLVTNSSYLEGFEWNDEETQVANFDNWLAELVGV